MDQKYVQFRSSSVEKERLFYQYYQEILNNDGSIVFAGTLLERAARLYPQHIALTYRDCSLTFKELYKKSLAVSKHLITLGVGPGDRVGLVYENSFEFYLGYYGIWQTGAVVMPINTFLHDQEFAHIIRDAEPKVIILSDVFRERFERLADIQLPPCITEKTLKEITQDPPEDLSFKIPDIDPNAMAALLYTSGTTGFPKGVMLSSKNILTNIVQGICITDLTPKDKLLAVLPLFHSFAQLTCVWGNMFLGITTIVVPRIDRRYLLDGLSHKPTVITAVPALFGLFCLMRKAHFSNVRYFVSGGDALPDKIRSSFELVYRRRLCNGYGLTEASPVVAATLTDELLAPNTVGNPCLGVSCSLRDDEGNEVEHGQKGVLWVKGDNIMLGYYKDKKHTDEVLQDGWLNTGDLAYFDKTHRLVIFGRQKDLIVNKGIKIYPQEVENILLSHPLVLNAAVVGKKDYEVGEVPVAFVVLKEESPHVIHDLKKLCSSHLARYKIPHYFHVLKPDELPLTPLKKIDKKKLKKQFFGNDDHHGK